MGFASAYDTWVTPVVREAAIFGPMVCFWFSLQYIFTRHLPSRMPNWKRLTKAQQEEIIVRCCSITNGCLMSVSAFLFLANILSHDGVAINDMYAALPYYRFSRVSITAYFLWDIFVCFFYKWSWAWKIHGFCSFIGSYILLFPFSEAYAGYYTGCFELSNGFLHAAAMLRTLSAIANPQTQQPLIQTLDKYTTTCEYIFGGLYVLIRVIGGTYVSGSWLFNLLTMWRSDIVHSGESGYTPKLHNEWAAGMAAVALSGVQLLQYFWFGEIVKRAMGGGGGGDTEHKKGATSGAVAADAVRAKHMKRE
ncbi:hypothetical protein JKF63_04245 [Porcisia hertigi]|uniref:TLC domain-containing protein n=1 Tax=Porcisia hertigi TaxID=2761500 RepID=A0A836HZA9_9TRYP|nr:hypothetical protein JKF63_04245 [Porcisia hertigi]